MKKKLIFLLFLAGNLFPALLYAQLSVTNGANISMTPLEFVQTYLVGTGVTVSNATFNGSSAPLNSLTRVPNTYRDQIGSFTTTNSATTQLGVSGGVLLSTGYTQKSISGNDPSDDMQGANQPAESDPDLAILANNSIHDKSVLEFDFVPATEVVTFKYVFASIEFDTYCSSINDAFGLFLSGPDISGGLNFQNDAVNIALLPNSSSYVNIFNICAADNGNHGNGVYSWWNGMKFNFSYNRFTYVFTATYELTCNQTYHMKFAIGDASDGILDSGVFLEANSFSSNNVTFDNSYSIPSLGDNAIEGCSNATVSFEIASAKEEDFTIPFELGGSATPDGPTATNVDYGTNPGSPNGQSFPLSVTIPAGETQATIPIYAYQDGNDLEGDESVTFTVTNTTCSGSTSSTNTVIIKNNKSLTVGINPQSAVCEGSSITLTAVPDGGQPVYLYLWNDGAIENPHTFTPAVGNNNYTVLIADGCSASANASTSVLVHALPVVTFPELPTVCINTAPILLNMATPPGGVYSGPGVTGNFFDPALAGLGLKHLSYEYTDAFNCTNSAPQSVTVKDLPAVTLSPFPPVCLNAAPFTLSGGTPSGSGGVYSGPGVSSGTFIPSLAGAGTHTITYTYTDVDGCSNTAENTIEVNSLPTATISGTTSVCQNAAAPLITFTGADATAPYTFTYKINGGADQVVTTSAGNSVTVAAPTAVVGTFVYSLVSVQDASSTTCSQSQVGNATVVVNPLPTATIAGSTSVCQNAAAPLITFTGADATAPYTFTYKINGGADQVVTTSAGNSVTVAAPTGVVGTFVYSLVSVQDASSTTCSQSQVGNATISVNPLPTATISGTTSVCQNAAAPLITFTGASATAPYTFTYKINGGADQVVTTSAGNSVTVAAPTAVVGTFVYSLVSVQDASSTTCSQSQVGSATISVNPLPTATIAGSTSVCQNAAAPLITFTGAEATAPYTFTYQINGGADQVVTTSAGNSVTVAAPTGVVGTFVYSLVSVQDASSTTCSQSQVGSATISVNPLPTATIAGSTSVCQNAAAPLITFTGADATAPYTFTYQINGGADQVVTTSAGNSVTVAAPTAVVGTFVYSLVSVQDASSTTCSQSQVGSATISVNPLPTATISGTTSVCQNAAAPLITFTGAEATAPYTFTYKINGGADQVVTTSAGNSVTVAAPTAVVGTFVYSLVSVQDASSTTCSQSQVGSATVVVNPLPTATIAGTTAVCQNAAAPLITFTGADATAPYTFTYKINGGADQVVTTTVGNSVSVIVPTGTGGTFVYSLVSVQDASSTTCSQSQVGSATVVVNPLPTATIAGTTPVCQNSPSPMITFTGLSATAPYSFTYNINGGPNQVVTTTAGSSVTVAAPTNTLGTFTYNLIRVQDGSSTSCSQLQSGSATITVNSLPIVALPACFDLVTTKNAKPFVLKGGTPLGAGGKYYIDGNLVAGNVLDPSTLGEGSHSISFTYTDINTCQASAVQTMTVYRSNADYQCVNNTFTDPRNTDPATNKYPTFQITANSRTSCWMIKNLNWGNSIASALNQTDNCTVERYCPPNDNSCSAYGSLFQWDELMQYGSTPGWSKGVCPPGWHVPTSLEWQDLIDACQGNGIAAGALKDPLGSFLALLNGMYYLNTTWAFTAADNLKGSMFWTSTMAGSKPLARGINMPNPSVSYYESSKANAFPVRCVKD